MISFGIIAEGITDQIVIENILSGYFNSPDIDVTHIQPSRDETEKMRTTNAGGWTEVFKICESDEVEQALAFLDYIIIQIDTDTCDGFGYDIDKRNVETGVELSPDELIEKVCQKLQSLIGEDFCNRHSEEIIFAVAVHSTECWLLPLYYSNANKSATKNCLDRLNRELNKKKEGFTISAKEPKYYENISKQYLKNKTLNAKYKHNPSFKIFIEELDKREINIEE